MQTNQTNVFGSESNQFSWIGFSERKNALSLLSIDSSISFVSITFTCECCNLMCSSFLNSKRVSLEFQSFFTNCDSFQASVSVCLTRNGRND